MVYTLKTEETITCPKTTIKAVEICLKSVKYVQN